MNEPSRSLVLRWARWQTRTLVRVWPEESRRWGEAIRSEAEEIEQPLQAVGWALGGVTVYLRALGSYLVERFKMPVGQRSTDGGAPLAGARGPKRSRLFAAVLLASATVLLCLPEGREAIRTVVSTWENYAQVDTRQAELEKLAQRAERKNDPQGMAFAALGLEDGKRAMELADRAVKLEPHLFWIYEARRFWPDDLPTAENWIAKARAADPQNAAPYLRAADRIGQQVYSGLAKQPFASELEQTQALIANPDWVMLMDKAFRAPQYNSYRREHEELIREVWRRTPQLSMGTVLPGLWASAIPNWFSLDRFTDSLIRQAEQQRATEHMEKAQELLREVDGFAKRMEEDSERNARFVFGLALERKSALGWQAFYQGTGQTAKAQEAAQRAMEIDQREAVLVQEGARRWRQRSRLEGSGWVVEVSALMIMLAVLAAGAGIGWFEMWPATGKRTTVTRRILSWLADFAPPAVLLASAVLLLGFLPYARVMAAFREGSAGTSDLLQLSTAFWSLETVTRKLAGPDTAVFAWTALTLVLSLVAALLLARMVYRPLRRSAPQV